MPSVTLICEKCNYTARRELLNTVACRGIYETPSELSYCPKGHGLLIRQDGFYTRGESTNPIPKKQHDWVWKAIEGVQPWRSPTSAINICSKCGKTKPSMSRDDSECPSQSP